MYTVIQPRFTEDHYVPSAGGERQMWSLSSRKEHNESLELAKRRPWIAGPIISAMVL